MVRWSAENGASPRGASHLPTVRQRPGEGIRVNIWVELAAAAGERSLLPEEMAPLSQALSDDTFYKHPGRQPPKTPGLYKHISDSMVSETVF